MSSGFHLLAYHKATGAASTDQDTPAVTDLEFSIRNGHFVFSEQQSYKLLAAAAQGATITRVNLFVPSLNAFSLMNIWPLIASADMPSRPNIGYYMDRGIMLPPNEEIQVNNTDGASENVDVFAIIGTPDWNANLPAGVPYGRIPAGVFGPIRATAGAPTGVIGSWVTGNALTLQQNLQNGVYAVVGAQCQGDDIQAFRIVFPKVRTGWPRKLRPGFLANNTVGDGPPDRAAVFPFLLGEWGRFWSAELPTVDVYANSADVLAPVVLLWLVYLGTDLGLLSA